MKKAPANYICLFDKHNNQLCFDLNTLSACERILINLADYDFPDKITKVKYSNTADHKYHIVLWTKENQEGNPYHADHTVNDIPQETKSIEIYEHQGIWLCEQLNYGEKCILFGGELLQGDTGVPGEKEWKFNLKDLDPNLANNVKSVKYSSEYDGRFHTVLYCKEDETGELYHADHSVPDLKEPYNDNIESVKIYRTQPPPDCK